MPTLYCSACAHTPPNLTQEGLSDLAIRLGYWRCLDCGRTIKPLIMPDLVAQDDGMDMPAGGEADEGG
ncbi:hypothetical protein [Nitratidesulfovibrio sp. 1201_IL3209]|uniref:hypothetical protein n=1 Tax=Nitratidesulfovibrio sp. 1201_IL3209 TaxID=3084053 RepID=UPI002FD9710A